MNDYEYINLMKITQGVLTLMAILALCKGRVIPSLRLFSASWPIPAWMYDEWNWFIIVSRRGMQKYCFRPEHPQLLYEWILGARVYSRCKQRIHSLVNYANVLLSYLQFICRIVHTTNQSQVCLTLIGKLCSGLLFEFQCIYVREVSIKLSWM